MGSIASPQGGLVSIGGNNGWNVTASTLALTDQYVHGTSGGGVGIRFVPPAEATKLVDVYAFETVAPVASIDFICHLAAFQTGAANRPGASSASTMAAGGTANNKWLKFTFGTPPTVAAPQTYWVAFGMNAAGGGYTLGLRGMGPTSDDTNGFRAYTTANGFSATGEVSVGTPVLAVLHFQDASSNDYYIGWPLTSQNSTSFNNSTRRRGIRVKFTEQLKIQALTVQANLLFDGAAAKIQVYSGTTAPGTGNVYDAIVDDPVGFGTTSRYVFNPQLTFNKNTIYRVVLLPQSATQLPGVALVDDPATDTSVLLANCTMGGEFFACEDNGAGAWVDHNNATDGIWIPRMSLIVGDQVAIPAAGLLVHPGMGGGMRG